MKILKFITEIAAMVLLLASCGEIDDVKTVDEGKFSTLKIRLAGESAKTRGAIDPGEAVENEVQDFMVYVFNANTNKLQYNEFVQNATDCVIEGLTTGPKKIVAIANPRALSNDASLNVGDDITLLNSIMVNLADQSAVDFSYPPYNGFVMSGDATITLAPGSNTMQESLKVKRVVSKVRLGNVVIAPAEGHGGDFQLKKVHVMKAIGSSSVGPGTIYPELFYCGGMNGTVSELQYGFLFEYITNSDHAGRYFYLLPNDNTNGNATLLTLEGTYDGKIVYFPIRINDPASMGVNGSTTDGLYIQRNHVYTINVTIKRPGDGSIDPEVPVDPATLQLTVEVEPWATEIIQNVEI